MVTYLYRYRTNGRANNIGMEIGGLERGMHRLNH